MTYEKFLAINKNEKSKGSNEIKILSFNKGEVKILSNNKVNTYSVEYLVNELVHNRLIHFTISNPSKLRGWKGFDKLWCDGLSLEEWEDKYYYTNKI